MLITNNISARKYVSDYLEKSIFEIFKSFICLENK
jgi:hypothetical protein